MIILPMICVSFAYDVAVVGASGNLGRELVYQAVTDYDANVLALTSQPHKFYKPCRKNSFNCDLVKEEFEDPKITLDNYWSHINDNYKHIIFCTSSKPFQKDYSDKLLRKFESFLSPECESISLISAFGVGDSIKDGNLGIQVMDNFYLKDVYRSKNVQEEIVKSMDSRLKKYIYRPRALSFGKTFLDSTPRKKLAKNILETIL